LSQTACLSDITVDVYVSPRELSEGGLELQSAITSFIQAFGRDVVFAHLQRFATRCHAEGVRPPRPSSKSIFPNRLNSDLNVYNPQAQACQCVGRIN
jgi:hypothetical protein